MKPQTRPKTFLSLLIHSWNLLLDSWKLTSISALCDVIFFVLFSWLATWTVQTLADPLNQIYTIAGEQISTLATNMTDPEAAGVILSNYEGFMTAYQAVIKTSVVFLVGAFVLWIILQSVSWYIAHAIASGKREPKELAANRAFTIAFLKRFCSISLAGMLVIVGILYLSIRLSMWVNVSRLGDSMQAAASFFVAALLFLTLYGVFCGYAAEPTSRRGTTLRVAIRQAKRMIPAYLLALLLTYAGSLILQSITPGIPLLGLAFGLLVVAPSFTYERVLMILSASDK